MRAHVCAGLRDSDPPQWGKPPLTPLKEPLPNGEWQGRRRGGWEGTAHAPGPGKPLRSPSKGAAPGTTWPPTLTDSGLVMMTEVLWKTLTRTTGPYFLALETEVSRKRRSVA